MEYFFIKKKILVVGLCWLSIFGLSGCYFSGKVTKATKAIESAPGSSPAPSPPPLIAEKVKVSDFVSGSTEYMITPLRNYRVLSAVGDFNKNINIKTARGYTVYTSTQGVMISVK